MRWCATSTRARYWTPARCAELPAALAFFHFDAVVNHGITGATRLLQRAVGTDPDGEMGPHTLAAIAALPVEDVLQRYAETRRARYRALPHFWRFGRGWLARVDTALARALVIAGESMPGADTTPIPTTQEKGPQVMTDHERRHATGSQMVGASRSPSGAPSSPGCRRCCRRWALRSASTSPAILCSRRATASCRRCRPSAD
ncbi:MAG: putative peptidoglycan-binding domain-containing protein [Hyphomicrobium sp.]